MMMSAPPDHLSTWSAAVTALLDILLRTSIQGGLVIALVWTVCRVTPRMPPALCAGLWWLACLKLLVGVVWIEPVKLPVVPATPVVSVTQTAPVSPRSIHA